MALEVIKRHSLKDNNKNKKLIALSSNEGIFITALLILLRHRSKVNIILIVEQNIVLRSGNANRWTLLLNTMTDQADEANTGTNKNNCTCSSNQANIQRSKATWVARRLGSRLGFS